MLQGLDPTLFSIFYFTLYWQWESFVVLAFILDLQETNYSYPSFSQLKTVIKRLFGVFQTIYNSFSNCSFENAAT